MVFRHDSNQCAIKLTEKKLETFFIEISTTNLEVVREYKVLLMYW